MLQESNLYTNLPFKSVESVDCLISRRGRKERRVTYLAVNADAGGVAVARDGERRGGC